MSQYRDPFPMASEEAKNLQSSVEGGSNLAEWNSMNTESHDKGPSDVAIEKSDKVNESSESLSGKPSKGSDDIYANLDKPENPDDDFLDIPLHELHASPVERFFYSIIRFFRKVYANSTATTWLPEKCAHSA
ncbi:hypothetical protein MHU86_740 [Fragilaria crotonensis]|nr:hypothetical protein MHU86_740 [Fragilaria crotonensis]